MPEYTYDDVITAKDILTGKVKKEDIIGRSGWFLDCIPEDMSLNVIARIGFFSRLDEIEIEQIFPFRDKSHGSACFLPEKKVSIEERKAFDKPADINELDLSVFSSLETIWEIAPSLCPRIKGYTINDSGEFIAFDNTAGEFFTESFDTREEAIRWLNGTGTKEEMALKQVESIPEWQLSGYYNSRKPEYTEADIISDINDPRLEGSIGKVCYVAHHLYDYIVANANNDDKSHKGILINLGYDPAFPFEVHTEMGLHWKQIIIAKNQPSQPEYVPFDLSREEDRQLLRGKWLRSNQNREEMITGFHMLDNGKWTADMSCFANATGDGLFRFYTFLDGTQCGKRRTE